jgi:site-specific DNA-adenine methylase
LPVRATLAAEALHFRDRHPLDSQVRHRLTHFVQLEGFDDRGDEFHYVHPPYAGFRWPGNAFSHKRTTKRLTVFMATSVVSR